MVRCASECKCDNLDSRRQSEMQNNLGSSKLECHPKIHKKNCIHQFFLNKNDLPGWRLVESVLLVFVSPCYILFFLYIRHLIISLTNKTIGTQTERVAKVINTYSIYIYVWHALDSTFWCSTRIFQSFNRFISTKRNQTQNIRRMCAKYFLKCFHFLYRNCLLVTICVIFAFIIYR